LLPLLFSTALYSSLSRVFLSFPASFYFSPHSIPEERNPVDKTISN
jgi:hypothetical protein